MPRPTNLVTHESLLTEEYGPLGTAARDQYEAEVDLAVLSYSIKAAREARGLTQEALGELVGVGRAQISKLENGIKDARLSTIERVFRALDMSVTVMIRALDGGEVKVAG